MSDGRYYGPANPGFRPLPESPPVCQECEKPTVVFRQFVLRGLRHNKYRCADPLCPGNEGYYREKTFPEEEVAE